MRWPCADGAHDMKVLRQIIAVSSINVESLPQRLGASCVMIIGTAGTVAVLISVLAMGVGFARTVAGDGRTDRAVIVSAGAANESASSIPRDEVTRVVAAPGMRHGTTGDAIADAELLVQFQVARRGNGKPASVALRGVGRNFAALRPEVQVVEGRQFRPGLHEIIIGHTAQAQYQGLDIGRHVAFAGSDWSVVGIFKSAGTSSLDSGALGDAETLMTAFHHNWFNSVTVLLEGPAALAQLKNTLAGDVALHIEVQRESEYLASQARGLNTVLEFIGYFVGGMMAVGAVFSALNTMYGAVSARSIEIATLRAVGFGAGAVVISVLSEAMLLAILGAIIGSTLAWLLFDGHVSSLGAGGGGTQIAFALSVTPGLVALGVVWAFVVGSIGGLFPAFRAARMPIAKALTVLAR
jgi:putative ABC transport system permease protein